MTFLRTPCPRRTPATSRTDAPQPLHPVTLEGLTSRAPASGSYRLLDQYRSEREPTSVPTLELSGDNLKAIFTPQWGGKVYSLLRGKRELVMMTNPHQPIPSSVRNGQVDGGIEWNWSPGMIGHWADTVRTARSIRCCCDAPCWRIEGADP